jgi:hypothetical protein
MILYLPRFFGGAPTSSLIAMVKDREVSEGQQQLKSKRNPAMDAGFNAIKFLILKFIFLNLIPKFK